MENSNTEVGRRIFDRRKQLKYTREKLAEMAEISVQFLADIEKGRKSMTIATLRRICLALDVTADHIVFGTEQRDAAAETEKEPDRERDKINALLSSLSPYNKLQAEKLLAIFTETIKNNKG